MEELPGTAGPDGFLTYPGGGKAVVGIVHLSAHTDVDTDQHMVYLSNLQITKTDFPSLDPATTAQMDQLVRTFLPPGLVESTTSRRDYER